MNILDCNVGYKYEEFNSSTQSSVLLKFGCSLKIILIIYMIQDGKLK